jgi:hypothetical protein
LNLLLPMLTGGVGAGQQSYQPGAADAFAQLLPVLMQYYGSLNSAPSSGSNYTPVLRYAP